MKILYFGVARDLAGTVLDDVDIAGDMPVDEVWRLLLEMHPKLVECRPYCKLAADMEYVGTKDVVRQATDELAVIPPVAGG